MKTNFQDWLEQNKENIFRFNVYRRIFTPIEQEKKYVDQMEYDPEYIFGKIISAIVLPDNDVLLEIREYIDDEPLRYFIYHKLSEVRISLFGQDQEGYVEEN